MVSLGTTLEELITEYGKKGKLAGAIDVTRQSKKYWEDYTAMSKKIKKLPKEYNKAA